MFYIGNGDSTGIRINVIYMLHSHFLCLTYIITVQQSMPNTVAISSMGKSLTSAKNVSNLKNSTRTMNKIVKIKQR